jgi:predicted nucleotidyltransferase component of viral defense system
MLSSQDLAHFAGQYRVSDAQIRRDHLISHILSAVPELGIPQLHFFGGTALCRTLLDGQRLSEDIDLLQADYESTLAVLGDGLPAALRREFPGMTIRSGQREGRGRSLYLDGAGVPAVKVYVGALHLERLGWTFALAPVSLRYPDLDAYVQLSCPTRATFAAMKMEAYCDRHAPRDLFDLAGLARIGALDAEAGAVLRAARGFGLVREEFMNVPPMTAAAWEVELAHQGTAMTTSEECRATIARALELQPEDGNEGPGRANGSSHPVQEPPTSAGTP